MKMRYLLGAFRNPAIPDGFGPAAGASKYDMTPVSIQGKWDWVGIRTAGPFAESIQFDSIKSEPVISAHASFFSIF